MRSAIAKGAGPARSQLRPINRKPTCHLSRREILFAIAGFYCILIVPRGFPGEVPPLLITRRHFYAQKWNSNGSEQPAFAKICAGLEKS